MLREYQNGRCYLCGQLMAPVDDMFVRDCQRSSVDHVKPRSKGGPNLLGNVALAHAKCNNKKGDRDPFPCEVLYAQAMFDFLTELEPEATRFKVSRRKTVFVTEPAKRHFFATVGDVTQETLLRDAA